MPNRCLREPIPEIFEGARLLDAAVVAHAAGDVVLVADLLTRANMPEVRAWTESLWGARSPYAPKRMVKPASALLQKNQRQTQRMPNTETQKLLHARDGYQCRYCGIPVIRSAVRQRFRKLYPQVPIWGRRNVEQHAAFQAMWAQYDHVLPHSSGGNNELANIVVTCAPCNYARMGFTLEEANLLDPRLSEPVRSNWDGLERLK